MNAIDPIGSAAVAHAVLDADGALLSAVCGHRAG